MHFLPSQFLNSREILLCVPDEGIPMKELIKDIMEFKHVDRESAERGVKRALEAEKIINIIKPNTKFNINRKFKKNREKNHKLLNSGQVLFCVPDEGIPMKELIKALIKTQHADHTSAEKSIERALKNRKIVSIIKAHGNLTILVSGII